MSTGVFDEMYAVPYTYIEKVENKKSGEVEDVAKVAVAFTAQSGNTGAKDPRDPEGRRLFTFKCFIDGESTSFRQELASEKHEGMASFSADGKQMVYCQAKPITGNRVDMLGLFFADLVDGIWVNDRAFEYNENGIWLFSPTLSANGRTLYFSANYEDGHGGFDLYRSKLKGGAWTKPENLGPLVNTDQNEIYPFIHPSGRLYFSSEGHDRGVDRYDLFYTKLLGDQWGPVIKLPKPLNTLSNDYHIWMDEDYLEGYLTSDRDNGTKDVFNITPDIPEFPIADPIRRTAYRYRINDRKLDTVDNNLFRYSWVINDTLELPGHDIIYRFPGPGIYHLKMIVFDVQLDTLLEPQTFKTLNIRLNKQAVFQFYNDTVRVNEEITFDASDTHLPDLVIDRYVWDFGDGYYATSKGPRVTHTYLEPGTFKVILGPEKRKEKRKDPSEIPNANFREIVVLPAEQ